MTTTNHRVVIRYAGPSDDVGASPVTAGASLLQLPAGPSCHFSLFREFIFVYAPRETVSKTQTADVEFEPTAATLFPLKKIPKNKISKN